MLFDITEGFMKLHGETNQFSASQEIPAFYETWRFIAAFTRALHLSLSWARSIQSMHTPLPPNPTS